MQAEQEPTSPPQHDDPELVQGALVDPTETHAVALGHDLIGSLSLSDAGGEQDDTQVLHASQIELWANEASRSRQQWTQARVAIIKPPGGRTGITLSNDPSGMFVLITAIDDEGAGAALLHVGDVLLSVNGVPVESHEQGTEMLRAAAGRILLGVNSFFLSTVHFVKASARTKTGITLMTDSRGHPFVSAIDRLEGVAAGVLAVDDVVVSINDTMVHTHEEATHLLRSAVGDLEMVISSRLSERVVKLRLHKPGPDVPTGMTITTDERGTTRVQHVAESGLAHGVLAPGDVLIDINGSPVESHEAASEYLRAAVGDIELHVQSSRLCTVTVSKPDEAMKLGVTLSSAGPAVRVSALAPDGIAGGGVLRVGWEVVAVQAQPVWGLGHELATALLKSSVGQLDIVVVKADPAPPSRPFSARLMERRPSFGRPLSRRPSLGSVL